MWYLLIIFVVVFEIVISIFAPYFPGVGLPISGVSDLSSNTTAELLAQGANPFSIFIDIMTFQIPGLEALSVIFYLCDLVLILCVIALIRGSN